MVILKCERCGIKFKTNRLIHNGRKRRFCTWKCAMSASWNTTMKTGKNNVSKRLDVREKMSKARKGIIFGDKIWNWKGDDVSYAGLHMWVKRKFGKPNKCENSFCKYPRFDAKGRIMVKPKRYEWANKSRKYIRIREDWIMLCVSCHRRFDS